MWDIQNFHLKCNKIIRINDHFNYAERGCLFYFDVKEFIDAMKKIKRENIWILHLSS